jgi:hypothetical protein
MDYTDAIKQAYEHIENNRIDQAVMSCLRISRNLHDYLYTAIFLREMKVSNKDFLRVLMEDGSHLDKDAVEFLSKTSLDYYIDIRVFDSGEFSSDGEERNVLSFSVYELDEHLDILKSRLNRDNFPTHIHGKLLNKFSAIQQTKNQIKTRCFNYLTRIELQLQAQNKSQNFLEKCHNKVNNYFKAHSEEVYLKLLKAGQLVDSDNPEDLSLLLTQVRRAIKAVADYFYPPQPSNELIKCKDGTERPLGNDYYLNRLSEYLKITFSKSSSRDLLLAEFNILDAYVRKINDVASKGVHSDVTSYEAQQGLIDLYAFLYSEPKSIVKTSSSFY